MPNIPQTVATHLIAHTAPGAVRDAMACAASWSGKLTAPPSDGVAWAQYLRLDVTAAARYVAILDSPALLGRIARRERRDHVRWTLALNPALPQSSARDLAAEAAQRTGTGRGDELAQALRVTRRGADLAVLILDFPHIWGEVELATLATAVLSGGDANLLRRAVSERGDKLAEEVLRSIHHAEYASVAALGPQGLLEVVTAIPELPSRSGLVSDKVAELLLSDGCDLSWQRTVLAAAACPEVLARAVSLSAAGMGLPLAEIADGTVDGLRSRRLVPVLGKMSELDVPVDVDVAVLLSGSRFALPRNLRLTPAARAHLMSCDDAYMAAAATLVASPEQAAADLNVAPDEVVAAVAPQTVEALERLCDAGLKESITLELYRALRWRANITGAARAVVLAWGTEQDVLDLGPVGPDAPAVAARGGELPQVVHHLLHKGKSLEDEDRRALAVVLSEDAMSAWLGWLSPNQPTAGDVAWLLEQPEVAGRVRAGAVEALSRSSCAGDWVGPYALVNPLPWAKVTNEAAWRSAASVLAAEFGENVEAWAAAAALLERWTGSLPELIDTVHALGHGAG